MNQTESKNGMLWNIGKRDVGFDTIFPRQRVLYTQYDSVGEFKPAPGDAVVFWGGQDISPTLYGQKRSLRGGGSEPIGFLDQFQWQIAQIAIAHNIPLIGVCRGAQLLTALAGGELVQHVDGHHGYHPVHTYDGLTVNVNSTHHQLMRPKDTNHVLLAWSTSLSDIYELGEGAEPVLTGEFATNPEAVWYPEIRGLAIQWHPEQAPTAPMGRLARTYVRQFIVERQ